MPKEDGKVKWYLRPISVVLLLFFVLRPFGLPLLYKSPNFSKTLKIILTIDRKAWGQPLTQDKRKKSPEVRSWSHTFHN